MADPAPTRDLPDRVREACAWVAARARHVRIVEDEIDGYAAALAAELAGDRTRPASAPVELPTFEGREERAAFAICLDAINFGSGWWPTIRKRPGHSGYFTVAAGLGERSEREGPWDAAELAELDAAEVARVLSQDPGHPLIGQFAAALRDVGAHLGAEHGGSFATLVDGAQGSAVRLAGTLAGWDAFADVSAYDGRDVPFFKRAQLATADVDRAGVAEFADLGRLTAFADNLVPHVPRVDGVLDLDPALTARIGAGDLLEHGSAEEVELRACTVQAVELRAAAAAARRDAPTPPLGPGEIDVALWNRGRAGRYKSVPRPRSRTTAY